MTLQPNQSALFVGACEEKRKVGSLCCSRYDFVKWDCVSRLMRWVTHNTSLCESDVYFQLLQQRREKRRWSFRRKTPVNTSTQAKYTHATPSCSELLCVSTHTLWTHTAMPCIGQVFLIQRDTHTPSELTPKIVLVCWESNPNSQMCVCDYMIV